MKKLLVLLLLLYAPSVSATALSDAANALSAGQWSSFISVTGGSSIIDDITYMDSAVWDSTAHKMYFTQMGEHFTNVDSGSAVWIYDEATNTVTQGARLSAILPTVASGYGYHAYDNHGWDPRNQKMYYHIDNQIAGFIYGGSPSSWGPTEFVYNPVANTWTGITPSAAKRAQDANSCCDAMAFFPERHGFYLYSIGFTTNLWFYNVDTAAWSAIAKIGVGSTWMILEYNAICRCMIFIDNGTRDVRRINLDGSITTMAAVPGGVSIYDGTGYAGSFIADPMSKNFIMYSTGGINGPDTAWRYDPVADTWTSIGTPPVASPNQGGMASAPIPELGVMASFSCGAGTNDCRNARMLLYKMTASTAGDRDYAKRCAQKGVTTCQPFNTLGTDYRTSDLVKISVDGTHGNLESAGGDRTNGTYYGSVDNSIRLSGAGSLKFQLAAGQHDANIAGQYLPGGASAFPDPWTGLGGNFGPNTDWYVQYAYRLSPEFITNIANYWGINPKLSIFHFNSASCASKELTVRNWNTTGGGQIMMYKDCGNRAMFTTLDGFTWTESTPYLFQQGDLSCAYDGSGAGSGNCFSLAANTWYTLYFKIHNGTWGSSNSTIEAWYAVNGAPYVKWLNVTANFSIDCDSAAPPCSTEYFNNITLTPFMTQLANSAPVDAFVWYDELIASRSPIAAPGQAPDIPPPSNRPTAIKVTRY